MGAQAMRSRAGLSPRWMGALILAAVALLFVVQNRDPVSLHLFFIEVSAPLWVAFLATIAVGGAIGWLLAGRRAPRG
jgi:lipopolysaccharide assembly protein A